MYQQSSRLQLQTPMWCTVVNLKNQIANDSVASNRKSNICEININTLLHASTKQLPTRENTLSTYCRLVRSEKHISWSE